MKKPLQIGITGGIGAGKSMVCGIFRHLGIATYDADRAARDLMSTDAGLIEQIKQTFGPASYFPDGTPDRKFLGQQAFGAREKIEMLNSFVHPRVAADYASWVAKNSMAPYVIKEAALLFEAGSYVLLDKIIVVAAPEEVRIARVLLRDPQRSRDEVQKIIDNQMSEAERVSRADDVIYNDGVHALLPQVLALHDAFFKRA